MSESLSSVLTTHLARKKVNVGDDSVPAVNSILMVRTNKLAVTEKHPKTLKSELHKDAQN